ncbi:trifunctional transcriptional regulator/proline dehydrogenase/L-glutamate gamma-semialdehyde dehydrogenase [Sinorhizobium sp. BG8]|uniref:trifunctional transcriptional regulator/proline dehydrogenase/L-glutamate gamma-semialdehyde dehydrogenase n=1 Tax=Sinorhizobium sp. BG8 TaxID=2613773 RepID=UPI00193CC455|nr:trifunctional transcriptional regulator/proline dehydrogenase/L-glutamate gamma-semialdehyde dehydrogenase [Sinorhizobium sp. BG8]QRM57324.1 trifunctional transcriptional regulator/proline dehydrogenase/L-glutamate gamma-semialdehyde dehydrogenase [Sinorhizobium sp. BG8]
MSIQSNSNSSSSLTPPASPAAFYEAPARDALRRAITSAYRRPEETCLPPLLDLASMDDKEAKSASALARRLVEGLRANVSYSGVQGLVHEYSLSSQEGVALMCLAEALLRVPDAATRDALIRDKIAGGDWRSHLGKSASLFVNAATWGLVVTGKLTATANETSLSSALTRLVARGGEPVIRKGVDIAMRLMGEQFVTGQTIEEALKNSRALEAKGFRYSYDMLGEAATTAEDAARYMNDYETAIHAIGRASAGRGVYDGPGISIKLSALHPRYSRAKYQRVLGELLPRVKKLAVLAKRYDIGLNIDAEEADRLELSLDLLQALAFDPDLAGWKGLGFVIQAYQKRCPFVIDWVIDLARRSGQRLMIRLVKGAYWDSEIKRAQVDGLDGYPVFTRKVHTDVSYLACAKKLLGALDAVFPQFATHNAYTLAAVMTMAGPEFAPGKYEFQCLHGMGEPLYSQVVGRENLNRPCRIYAPVGTHETLLAYLVRRLLENGANSSFVNRIADKSVPVEELIASPIDVVRSEHPVGAPHTAILHPMRLYGKSRKNSEGLDLSNEDVLENLAVSLKESAATKWMAVFADGDTDRIAWQPVVNPADRNDIVGHVKLFDPADVAVATSRAEKAAAGWASVPVERRAECLAAAADAMEARMPVLLGLIVREAGKSYPNAIAEVREAIDFLRYYAAEAIRTLDNGKASLGPVVCISPWNFPLAIFTGQVAAALAAGNPVLAKPAEETPLIAAEAVRLLHDAGVPGHVLQLLPGAGDVGAALVGDPRTAGVMFTGSTEVARLIQRQLAGRLTPAGVPVPLIAETGGQNALVVDSTALPEQVVGDVIASAFDSAGQRCSALRVLCLQEDVADRTLKMLRGALNELEVGNPSRLSVDVGPVITDEARTTIETHVERMAANGHRVTRLVLPDETAQGTFVAPTIIEIKSIADLGREVFGPVLHVVKYKRDNLDQLLAAVNATGYGLTFGLHTRIDETIANVVERVEAGNIYVNRNIIGAVVGVQPFGGRGLSGTGPKAGGPLYIGRLSAQAPKDVLSGARKEGKLTSPIEFYCAWLKAGKHSDAAKRCADYAAESALDVSMELPGPVGETNVYALHPRGKVLALAEEPQELLSQIGAIIATGNTAVVDAANPAREALKGLPSEVARLIETAKDWKTAEDLTAALFSGSESDLIEVNKALAERAGAIVPVYPRLAETDYPLLRLLEERSISTNTAAAGGNANLMTIG